MIEMHYYVTIAPTKEVHIQNMVMNMAGEHHIHSWKGFFKWKRNIDRKFIHIKNGECDCGLKIGDVKEYDGKVWHNEKFRD